MSLWSMLRFRSLSGVSLSYCNDSDTTLLECYFLTGGFTRSSPTARNSESKFQVG